MALLSAGFPSGSRASIKTALELAFKAKYGQQINVGPDSWFGAMIAILTDQLGTDWDMGQAVYDAGYVTSSEGVSLDNAVSLLGVQRKPATASQVVIRVTVSGACSIPTSARFANSAGVQVGPIAPLSAPTPGVYDVDCVAVDTGPFVINVNDFDSVTHGATIVTPITNLVSIANSAEAHQVGTNIESDADLKARYVLGLRLPSGASVDSLLAGVLAVTNVTDAKVYNNRTNTTDSNGVAPHTVEVVVTGGDSNAIAQAIYDRAAAGAGIQGLTSGVATGSDGVHTIPFTRPVDLLSYVTVSVEATLPQPADLTTMIQNAITARVFAAGQDVHSSSFVRTIFNVSSSITNVTLVWVSSSTGTPTPGYTGISSSIVANFRQKVLLDPSRVAVTLTSVAE
jgi:uncharacterized phage protein gp47/JayE